MTANHPPKIDPAGCRRLLSELRGLVLLHQELGLIGYPAPARPRGPRPERGPGPAPATPVSAPGRDPGAELAALGQRLTECRDCPLHCHRRHRQPPVFGQGDPAGRLLLIGPAPGAAEERAGRPFQGEAGALLDRMLAAIQLDRQNVYLTTLVKCAPPGGRPPAPEEIRACLPRLLAQIEILKPALICTLGQQPAQTLLRSSLNLLQLRGKFHNCQGIPLMPTLAPDFLLANPEMKRAAWEDLQLIQKRLTRR